MFLKEKQHWYKILKVRMCCLNENGLQTRVFESSVYSRCTVKEGMGHCDLVGDMSWDCLEVSKAHF